ncbi:hypothetical protein LTR36_008821 [Oleoguttula mirabilis]|uniref:Chromo domain-containing protein n=1 Tax=Oleoguttula mirabilis TaxID=1507867 RepID=A0AAV9J7D3_9PEZI|nr:hypothetical protein LTR36_008821 [Oleoguttula mirabilis]
MPFIQKGAKYELERSAQTTAWAQEGAQPKKLGPGQYPLEAIIAETVEHREARYLARWVGTDESTYEPARHFRAADIAEWKVDKAELEDIEMALDLDETISSDGGSAAPVQPPTASGSATANAPLTPTSVDEADPEMVDRQMAAPVAPADVSSQAPIRTAPPANRLIAAAALSKFVDDAEAEDVECNDRLGVDLAEDHSDARRCQGTTHPQTSVYTCSGCYKEARAMLDDEQEEAIKHGATRLLCHDCGEAHLEDAQAFKCKCSTMIQCGSCFMKMADALVAARRTLNATIDETTCAVCDEEMQGNEKVAKCALCHGLNVRW